MTIEIWSDFVCPFCYIGKRKFEAALAQTGHKMHPLQIIWRSFQLSPESRTDATKNAIQDLADKKRMSLTEAKSLTDQVAERAREVGIQMDFDLARAVNTFKAHRFLHFAMRQAKGSEVQEMLFRSYFTEGRNIDKDQTLTDIAREAGLDTRALKDALTENRYAAEVNADIERARTLGITGVPFFVFDEKYAVSGAQDTAIFVQTLERAWSEWQAKPDTGFSGLTQGESCGPDQNC